MKKVIFSILLAFVSVLSFTACTEENIAPTTENGGGVFEEPVKK